MADQQRPNDQVPHQAAEERVIDEHLRGTSAVGVLADVPAAAAAPTQAEFNALVTSHNSVLQVLRDAELIPAA